MSASSTRSPRPSSVACYQSSSPRLPSPLNPTPSSFSPSGRKSPAADEMSDTLSPLRERIDSGLTCSPLSSPRISQPRSSSLSRSPRPGASPELSPVTCSISLQSYTRHQSSNNSPLAQGVPFPSSSPLSPPLADISQSTMPYSPRRLSPPSGNLRQGSPASISGTRSQFEPCPLRSPPHPTQSHFHLPQSFPVQMVPSSSSRCPHTQSLIQQSFGKPYAAQAAPSPRDDPRSSRRVSVGAESLLHASPRTSPIPAGESLIQDMSSVVKGDSTPLNEAPIRWWGGRRGWLDDWDSVVQHSQGICDPYGTNFAGHGELDGAMNTECVQSGYGSPLAFREPFGRGIEGPGAFLDEEIRASFDGLGGSLVGSKPVNPLTPGPVHTPTGAIAGQEVGGSLSSRVVPVPIASGATRSRIQNAGYGEVDVGPPSVERGFVMQETPGNLTRSHSCHLHKNLSGLTLSGTISVRGQEFGHDGNRQEHPGARSRRFSNASTRSSASYASCTSGPSRSQLFFVSSSRPSLSRLGLGFEELEREDHLSKSFWGRRNSSSTARRHSKDSEQRKSTQTEGLQGGPVDDLGKGFTLEHPNADSAQSVAPTHEKGAEKHESIFVRIGSKQEVGSAEQAQHVGYSRAENCVSLAITSILPASTITKLSSVGEALVKARESAKFVGHELLPVARDVLSVSSNVLMFAPLPGLEEAAKALLSVWDACQKVDTNRLSCLRLAERCATLLYSVLWDINKTGSGNALAEPVERLCGALSQIRTFLETQLHRPFLKRYLRREEISRELQACNDAITDASSRFGISVQIRTFDVMYSAANESWRFAQEAQALLAFDRQIIQRQFAMLHTQRVQMSREEVRAEVSDENALGLSTDGTPMGNNGGDGSHLIPPFAHERQAQPRMVIAGPPPTMDEPMPTVIDPGSGLGKSPSSVLLTGHPSDETNTTVPMTSTPTPTKSTFVVEGNKIATTKTETVVTDPAAPMRALKEIHRAQDCVDATADEAALRGTLAGALDVRNDVEIIRRLQVARGEIPEAAETLRRRLGVGPGLNTRDTQGNAGNGVVVGNTDLDRKFMQSGIEAMMRLSSDVAKKPGQGEKRGSGQGIGAVGAQELPRWTITRYEVVRTRKIGMGFFSDVYLGHWRRLDVIIKVLAHSIPREAFIRHIEMWNALDHPNVLPLYGASSALGERPWFFVSKFCSGDNLATSLKRAKLLEGKTTGSEATVHVDPLRFMYEIAKGMAYLHGCGVLHGDLRAANVLVDEKERCILSDFGQHEIKSEAHRSRGQPEPLPIRWMAPEMLTGNDRPTKSADVYAFAMCCIEILGMGDLPWTTLDDRAIHELVLDKDGRPLIPVLADNRVSNAIANLVRSCWVREPDRRPSFADIVASLEMAWSLHGCGDPQGSFASLTSIGPLSAECSPADEHYETASESMETDIDDENGMMDVSLTSPVPLLGNGNMTWSVFQANAINYAEGVTASEQVTSGIPRQVDTPTHFMTSKLDLDMRNEENYRLVMASNHAFHSSLTLPLWSPTTVELGAVGYLSKPKGEFISLFNAIDPLQSCDERLRCLPSMYGYGKFEVQRREDGKRSAAQRGLDAISIFLAFKTRSDRSYPERIARQYPFSLVQGKASAHLCVEKTVRRYIDRLEAPTTWFTQHVDLILEVCAPRHAIRKEDLILVVGTLEAPDWAVFVSDGHFDGRAQFNVFAGREKGEPWGVYSVESAAKNGSAGPGRYVDVGQGTFASKVSCVPVGGPDIVGDTVMLAGLRFEKGMQAPTVM